MGKSYTVGKNQIERVLFTEEVMLSNELPRLDELKPTRNLSRIFDECHNYVYANEGLLKDKIFHEMVKILVMKLYDEENSEGGVLRFGITAEEYRREVLDKLEGSFRNRIEGLLRDIQRKYPSFIVGEDLRFQIGTLAYLVDRLQFINLGKTPGDIKGEAFQVFISRHQRGDRGEFFTPHPVVRLAVEMIDPKPSEQVIDPACGSGGFLIETIAHVLGNNSTSEKAGYIRKCIRGIEFNPDIAASAMVRLAFEGGSGKEISCRNALVEGDEENELFDVVLTNPPFGSKGKIRENDILERYTLARKWRRFDGGSWNSTHMVMGGQSPEILFIEKCMKILRPGGRMAIVLPDGLLQNVSSSYVRSWLLRNSKVLAVISIPQEAFIPYGTGIKTSLLLLQKNPVSDDCLCFMARMQRLGYDVKGQPVYKRNKQGKACIDRQGNMIVDDDVKIIAENYHRLREKGKLVDENGNIFTVSEDLLNLRLDVEHYDPDDQSLISHLRRIGSKELGEVAEVVRSPVRLRQKDEQIRYIAISDVDARTMQVVSQQTMKAHEAPSRATYQVHSGDIITAVSGASTGTTRHATAMITEDEEGAICSNGFAVLRNVKGVEPFFLLGYMRTEHYLRQVRRLMTGHAIPAIALDDLGHVLVPLLSQEKQHQVASRVEEVHRMVKVAREEGCSVIEETERMLR